MNKLAVIGLGNPLMGDDGIGPRVIRELRDRPVGFLPPGVELVEGGGCFADYWDLLHRVTHLVAVDAVLGRGAAGSIYLWDVARERPPITGRISHEDDFFGALHLANWRGSHPRVFLVGVEPARVDFSTDLSTEVSNRLPVVVETVRDQCRKYSIATG